MKEVVAVRRLLFFVVLLVSTMLPSWWWPVVAQAFQLPNNNNNNHHHHLVPSSSSSSLVHPHNQQEQQQTPTKAQTQPLLFPLPNKKTRKTPSSSSSSAYYHYFSSPIETVATQINRTVNRNTKNRQNHSICSLEKPHSTLHEITTTTTPSPPNSIINISSNNDNNNTTKKKTKKKESSIQRSLRQLGITIASLFIIVVTTTTTTTQQQWNVANAATIAAAAYTPLIVTHHPSTTTTTVTPLVSKTLSNSHHHHRHQGSSSSSIAAPLLLLPSSVMKMIMTGLYHPAIGDIIMSFAYVIIALGVSHMLANVAMGGHVKVMKLMAWQNLFEEEEDADAVDDATTATAVAAAAAAATKSTTTTTTTMKSRTTSSSSSSSRTNNILAQMTSEIQGLFSRYIYMIRLIFDEIHKASIIGQRYTTATTATSTTTPSNNMLSRYASNLNMSFQDIFKTYPTKKEKEEDGGSVVVGMNWEEYSKLLQQKKNKTKKSSGSSSSSSSSSRKWMKFGSRSGTKGGGGWVYNKFTMLFEPAVVKSDTEAEAIKKATDLFKQKQYEQHHHRVHVVVPHTQFEESTRYLDGLTKFASMGEVEQQQHEKQHAVVGTSKGYLDTLSEGEVVRKSTWEVYKGLVEKVVKEVKHQNEIDYLKEELAHIQSLLQDEQSMYQTSNQALNLVVEAQNEELKHARAASTQYSTTVVDELKEFDIKAKEYEEAMKESKKVESGGSTSTSESPHKWIF